MRNVVPSRRGKKKQKAYTVFVCEVTAAVMTAYKPQLNDEHREARWWPLTALPARSQLHPVVVRPHSNTLPTSAVILLAARFCSAVA